MFLTCLLLLNSILWQEDFTNSLSTISQLYEYTVSITHKDGKVFLRANPEYEGFASAWLYLDEDIAFNKDDALELAVKVTTNKLRINYYYYRKETNEYLGGEAIIAANEKVQTIKVPLKGAFPFYGGNFPLSLTPGKTPALYLFFDNLLPGDFDVEIDCISVVKEEK